MAKDVKIFNACDHIVDGNKYNRSVCPKCYGKGYYFDVNFDVTGQAVLTEGSIKLQQEMLKVIIDKKNQNPFHPIWGSDFDYIIGTKNVNVSKTRMEFVVRSALEHLKAVQLSNNKNFKNASIDEILKNIEYIEITNIGKTGYKVSVMISNTADEIFEQTKI